MRFISIVLVGKKPSFLIVANVRFCLKAWTYAGALATPSL